MPIFGLVWVASWVSCFFSSNQDLLQRHPALARVLPLQAAYRVSSVRDDRLLALSRDRILPTLTSQPVQPGSFARIAPQAPAFASTLAFDTGVVLPASMTSMNFLGAFKSLVSRFQKFTAPHPAPPVVVIQTAPQRQAAANVDQVDTSGLGFGQCAPIAPRRVASGRASSSHEPEPHSFFQVKIKDSIVGAAPTQQQATQLAHDLEQTLRKANVPFEQLQPGMVNGIPGGTLGDRVLFTVDKQVADQWDCHPEMLAIQWVNALRIALAAPPLALADAQAKIYGLQETGQRLEGIASWYGPYFHGRRTATGETFNQNDFTAAHPSLPFDTYLRVTNTANGKAVIVRVNDRGPYFGNRTLDLSREAARCLDSETNGVVFVKAEIMQPVKSVAIAGQAIAGGL